MIMTEDSQSKQQATKLTMASILRPDNIKTP